MNTQTHILLACAVFASPASAAARPALDSLLTTKPEPEQAVAQTATKLGVALLLGAAVLGALAPDASIFFMWGLSKWQGVPESVVWQQWYYSDYWQHLGAISNSIPLYTAMLIAAWVLGARFSTGSHNMLPMPVYLKPDVSRIPAMLFVFSLAALLHTLTDLPLHHDDGRPHFWPISQWIFRSPVSYWDPNHYGTIWSLVEVLMALWLILVLWRRYAHALVKIVLSAVGLSYLIVAGYWWFAF